MASDKGAHKDGMDERLAQSRDAALLDGEEIVAQEMGDQGQAIILTKSRILIIKAGLTATGTLNGQTVGAFALDEITAVNVRKGPMGAVIQVCVDGRQQIAQAGPPDNVIVFSGDQRVKKCDAIADKIESVLGKSVERIEPKTDDTKPDKEREQVEAVEQSAVGTEEIVEIVEDVSKPMRGGRQAKSLAEEMFEEMTVSEPDPPEPEAVEAVAITAVFEPVSEPENVTYEAVADDIPVAEESVEMPSENFRPNPFLPKPVRKKGGPKRSFILVGGLMLLVLVGMAVTSPLRNPRELPAVEINVDKLTRNAKAVRRQVADVGNYRAEVVKILASSNQEAVRLAESVRSGRKAVAAAAGKNASDKACRELTNLKVPSGLAGAKESLVLGTFTRKNAVANALSVGPIDTQSILARLSEADSLIKRGMDAIDKMEADLNKQLEPR
ncbi:MAG: hypothetical protein ACYC64_14595 [Armatimonadota bacterium]